MPKKGKIGKNRQDKFYHLAKEQGFRSRAAFKLVQLNKRYDFLSSAAQGVLDLCAAPGGWMQVARKYMPVNAPCIGIDLVPIRPVPGCVSLVGDITADNTRVNLLRTLRESGSAEKLDVVLNDGSPNMGKAWLQDAYTQSELTLSALKLATEFLSRGGVFITKVFRSNDYNSLLFVMHQLFSRVEVTKPSASRAESAEIYVMCIGYKSPKIIDPHLLNPRYVFKDVSSKEQVVDGDKPDVFLNTVLKDIKKRKRNREGYEDGATILFKKVSILEFCMTSRPVALMADASQFSFEPHLMLAMGVSELSSKRIAGLLENMEITSSEVLSCCEDLKVLARREFKLLLKWRSKAREELRKHDGLLSEIQNVRDPLKETKSDILKTKDDALGDGDNNSGTEGDKEDTDDDDAELKKVRSEMDAAERRKKRKARKMDSIRQKKIDLNIALSSSDNAGFTEGEEGLFSLSTIKRGEKHYPEIADTGLDLLDNIMAKEEQLEEENERMLAESKKTPSIRLEEAETVMVNRMNEVEAELDQWYKSYLRHKKRDKNGVKLEESKEMKRIKKRELLKDGKVDTTGDSKENNDIALVMDSDESTDDYIPEPESINDGKSEVFNRDAALWFSQPVFQGMGDAIISDDEDGDDGDSKVRVVEAGNANVTEDFHKAALTEAERLLRNQDDVKNEDEMEVVPQDNSSVGEGDGEESSESFHSSDYDSDEKAEMVAIGMRLRKSKKEMENVVDEGYHRYTFDDPDSLPRWFADQDGTYRDRQTPVKKEDVEKMKEYIKSLGSKPTKRESEAKARRRARAAKKMEDMKSKANTIAEQSDVPVNARMKAIEDVYRKAIRGSKGKQRRKVYQVSRPGGRMTVGKAAGGGRAALRGARTVLVDRRLKSDKRGIAKAQKRKKR